MPIKVQNDLPAKHILENENIFVMDEKRAQSQEIRPLRIAILNLMPLKEDTELELPDSDGDHLYDCGDPRVEAYRRLSSQ